MRTYTSVCLEHRTSGSKNLICPICHKEMRIVPRRLNIPKKDDDDGWEQFIIDITNAPRKDSGALFFEPKYKWNRRKGWKKLKKDK